MHNLRKTEHQTTETYYDPCMNTPPILDVTCIEACMDALFKIEIGSLMARKAVAEQTITKSNHFLVNDEGSDFSISHEITSNATVFKDEELLPLIDTSTADIYMQDLSKVQPALNAVGISENLSPIQREWLVEEILAKFLAYSNPTPEMEILIPNRNTGQLETYRCLSVDIFDGMPMFILEPVNHSSPPYVVFRGTYCAAGLISDVGLKAVNDGIGTLPFEYSKEVLEIIFESLEARFGKINVCGHSLGGSLTMLSATEFPQFIRKASAFNAPKVSEKTADQWHSIKGKKPILWVTNPDGDPVTTGGTFIIGTRITVTSQKINDLSSTTFGTSILHSILIVNKPGTFTVEKEGCWTLRNENMLSRTVSVLTGIITKPLKLFGAAIATLIYSSYIAVKKTSAFFFNSCNQFSSELYYPHENFLVDLKNGRNTLHSNNRWDIIKPLILIREKCKTPPVSEDEASIAARSADDISSKLRRCSADYTTKNGFVSGPSKIQQRSISDPGPQTSSKTIPDSDARSFDYNYQSPQPDLPFF